MDSGARKHRAARAAPIVEFSFIPDTLRSQCRNLIQTFHAMHGYSCLPNMLWKAGLSGFIEKHRNLNDVLRKASTTRSARQANDMFVTIATEILSLEVLAREYANWSAVLPAAKTIATEMLDASTPTTRTWLMEHYLYPPRYNSPAVTITLPLVPSPLASTAAPDRPPRDSHEDLHEDPHETTSFRDIVLACRKESQARQSRSAPTLVSQDFSER
ncbi:hypothetical protein [Bradyrhizobium prioriisuperbiae]|uniref:hypothetical protein n=1 Tax=Bradyrhizobium prioriisuperbiae TaxID=2854389 RepID=UPI0028ECBE00|nr:hypothetical protein [Bradyrhizobium prioritasuperba]